jgi:glycine cleavage system H protein
MPTEYFTRDHEWVRVDGDVGTVGITDYAQSQLGDVVFVEVPDAGKALKQKDSSAVVESVKAAGEIYAPISGSVIEGNADLAANPAWVNEEPMGKAWFYKIKLADAGELSGLMDTAAYKAYLLTLG